MGAWETVTADLLDVYGVDLYAPGLLESRPYTWLLGLLSGLLSSDTRTARLLSGPPTLAPAEPPQID